MRWFGTGTYDIFEILDHDKTFQTTGTEVPVVSISVFTRNLLQIEKGSEISHSFESYIMTQNFKRIVCTSSELSRRKCKESKKNR